MASLVLVALLAAAVLLIVWQRRGGPGGASALRVRCRVQLSARAGLALVETDDEQLVVAWGESPPRLIARVSPDGRWAMPDDPPEETRP